MSDGDDLERIEALHRADVEASRRGDFRTLRSLMSDDPVVLPPGGRVLRGREALDASFARMAQAAPSAEVLEYDYALEWCEVRVCGDYAFERGYIVGRERSLATGEETSERHHVVRVLQRQPGGDWKVHRTELRAAAGEPELCRHLEAVVMAAPGRGDRGRGAPPARLVVRSLERTAKNTEGGRGRWRWPCHPAEPCASRASVGT